jgi:tRNA(adenine34) deaminase
MADGQSVIFSRRGAISLACLGLLSCAAEVGPSSLSFQRAEQLPEAELREHSRFMRRAIELATRAGGAHFGALITDSISGEMLSEGANNSERNPLLHAEIVAILNCRREDLERSHLSIYTTAEPCSMCFGAIGWAGIDRIVYGTSLATLRECGVRQVYIDSVQHAKAATDFRIHTGSIIGDVLSKETDLLYRYG